MPVWVKRATGVYRPPSRVPFLLLCWLSLVVAAPASLHARSGVTSLFELRTAQVTMQNYDLSCGAAALASLLNYHHGDPVTEREIALALIDRDIYLENPDIVRLRQGFSLADLKRFADARGYVGTGYGEMDLDSALQRAPLIVPITLNGYKHFVVVRGRMGDRILVADPSFGNVTMTVAAFEHAWMAYEGMGRVGFTVERRDGLAPLSRMQPKADEFVFLR